MTPMDAHHDDLAAAERLIQLGYDAEARRILIALVDAVPLNGRAWYLLSRVAENNEQRTRFLRRAQQMGYLDSTVPIDEDALSVSAQTSARPHVPIDRTALQSPPSTGAVAVKGGCLALGALLLLGFCVAGAGGSFSADLGGLLLIFLIGSLVAMATSSARQR
jgi:hypothetical protein